MFAKCSLPRSSILFYDDFRSRRSSCSTELHGTNCEGTENSNPTLWTRLKIQIEMARQSTEYSGEVPPVEATSRSYDES